MPQTVIISGDDDGRTVRVDAGTVVRVEPGPRWREPRLRPLGGEPSPVRTPLVAETSTRHLEPGLGWGAYFRAVSAGRVAVRAVPVDGGEDRFEVTVVVRPRPGTKAPLTSR